MAGRCGSAIVRGRYFCRTGDWRVYYTDLGLAHRSRLSRFLRRDAVLRSAGGRVRRRAPVGEPATALAGRGRPTAGADAAGAAPAQHPHRAGARTRARAGTRWFWFWVLTGVPLGLGQIWWLARERPWYPADQPSPDASGRDQRDRYYVGLLIGIATSIAASVLLYGLRHLLGDWYVPHDAGN